MITSPRNKRVTQAVRLKKRALREKDRRLLVEGAQGVLEALRGGGVSEVFHTGSLPAAITEAAAATSATVLAVSEPVMALPERATDFTPEGASYDVAFDSDGNLPPL